MQPPYPELKMEQSQVLFVAKVPELIQVYAL